MFAYTSLEQWPKADSEFFEGHLVRIQHDKTATSDISGCDPCNCPPSLPMPSSSCQAQVKTGTHMYLLLTFIMTKRCFLLARSWLKQITATWRPRASSFLIEEDVSVSLESRPQCFPNPVTGYTKNLPSEVNAADSLSCYTMERGFVMGGRECPRCDVCPCAPYWLPTFFFFFFPVFLFVGHASK